MSLGDRILIDKYPKNGDSKLNSIGLGVKTPLSYHIIMRISFGCDLSILEFSFVFSNKLRKVIIVNYPIGLYFRFFTNG